MKLWKTSISSATDKETIIRGHKLENLIANHSFTEVIFLTLKGHMPSPAEEAMCNAIFVSAIDHGMAPPSTQSTRLVLSGGNSLHVGVAAGILAFGDHHAGAVQGAAHLLQTKFHPDKDLIETASSVIDEYQKNGAKIPGLGHKIYTTDPRTEILFQIAERLGMNGYFLEAAKALERSFEKHKGKKLCLNVDGAIASLISTMGFPWQSAKAFFIISRTVGLCAHGIEELMYEKPFRRLSDDDIEYTGRRVD